jgi:hypothetical protein
LVGAYVARSIAVFGPAATQAKADATFEKLATTVTIPQWLLDMGNITVGDVFMIRDDLGDGQGVYFEYIDPLSDAPRTIGVYIDATMDSIAHDVIDGPPLQEIREVVANETHVELVAMDPAEARARVEAAFAARDEIELDPDESFEDLRALAEQRFALLPAGGTVPAVHDLSEDEVEALLDAFVASPHFFGVADLAREIGAVFCEFATDLRSDPLRWSPVVVEIFLLDWLPNEVEADDEFFRAVPDVLRAWIRFAGERRGLATDLIEETVASIERWEAEYRASLGPDAATVAELVKAMLAAGIDTEDERAVQAFIDDYRAGLAGVDVDLDRAEEGLREQWRAFETQLVGVLQSSLDELRDAPAPADVDPRRLDDATTVFETFAMSGTVDLTDLLRMVTTLAGDGQGADASADRLSQFVGPDASADRAAIGDALGELVAQWHSQRIVDDAHRLTATGAWMLPRALARHWGGDFDR